MDKPPPAPSRWSCLLLILAVICGAIGVAWYASNAPSEKMGGDQQSAQPPTRPAQDTEQARFGICFGSSRVNCIVDGDTFWYQRRKIRIADINTPEISRPDCASEKALGERAKWRLHQLLNQGGFSLKPVDRERDRYGRELWIITRNGQSLGDTLVDEGLAHPWRGQREPWCG